MERALSTSPSRPGTRAASRRCDQVSAPCDCTAGQRHSLLPIDRLPDGPAHACCDARGSALRSRLLPLALAARHHMVSHTRVIAACACLDTHAQRSTMRPPSMLICPAGTRHEWKICVGVRATVTTCGRRGATRHVCAGTIAHARAALNHVFAWPRRACGIVPAVERTDRTAACQPA